MTEIERARARDRQQILLTAISVFWRQNGYAPSICELQALCDISSTSVVKYHLERLRTAGLHHVCGWNAEDDPAGEKCLS